MSEIFQEEDSGSGKLVFRPNASFLSSLSREMVGHGPAVLLLYSWPVISDKGKLIELVRHSTCDVLPHARSEKQLFFFLHTAETKQTAPYFRSEPLARN